MLTFPYHWHGKRSFLIDDNLLNISLACRGQLVKIPITPETYWIFGSNFKHLFILILSNHWYAKW